MFRFTYTYPPSEKIEKLEERANTPNAPCKEQMIAWIDCMKGAQVSQARYGIAAIRKLRISSAAIWHPTLRTFILPFSLRLLSTLLSSFVFNSRVMPKKEKTPTIHLRGRITT